MNLLMKISSAIMGFGASKGLSLVSVLGSTVNSDEMVVDVNYFAWFVDAIASVFFKILYAILSFIMMILDFFQVMIYRLMGVGDVMGGDYVVFDQNNPLVKFLTNDVVLDAFFAILVVAFILIIGFTIFSIIMSEYKAATGDGENSKGRILGRTLRSFLMLSLFPAILIGGVVIVNALLAGFNNVFNSDIGKAPSLGNTIFMASTANANKYRLYAESGDRIPILFDFEDPYEKGSLKGYTELELLAVYENFKEDGKAMYEDFAYRNFPAFGQTLSYNPKTKKVYNSSSYAGFEKFLCTPEQYYVMADFIEYAFSTGLDFSIKSVKDDDIEWKYIDATYFNKDTKSLKITYRDASGITGEEDEDDQFYTIEYSPTSLDATTPISDAFDTIANILAINQYSDNKFDILSREEDSINLVFWENDKAILRLTKDYKTNPTYTDLIILYEFYRYEYNNTIDRQKYKISDLEKGIELPVLEYARRVWRSDKLAYITTEIDKVVRINNNYYKVIPTNHEDIGANASKYPQDNSRGIEALFNLKDSFGDYYYAILPQTKSVAEMIRGSATQAQLETGNVIKLDCLTGNKYFFFEPGVTFEDMKKTKLNGSFENIIVNPDGSEKITYSFYDDRVTEITKKVNWPQKLINDMQTIYSDINVNLLITTGDWLTKLSEIVGSTTSGSDYGQTFDTSLIHPLGLMISELFLNEIHENNEDYYGEYKFHSSLSEQDIRSILLAVAGEDNYHQLSKQIEYFVEIFNAFMVPVLEDIAYFENIDLMEGNSYSEQIYTYKAYLCSVLLSSACAEYLFDATIAIVGASEFSYDLLKYADIVEDAYEDVLAGTHSSDPVYVYVTIDEEEFAMLDGGIGGLPVDPEQGANEYSHILEKENIELSYLEFMNKYKEFDYFFELERDASGNILYDAGGQPTVISSAIRKYIEDELDYSAVIDYTLIPAVVDEILSRVIVVSKMSSESTVQKMVSSIYKNFSRDDFEENMLQYYDEYLDNIYESTMAEIKEMGYSASNPDYEHVTTLKNYRSRNIPRWSYVKRADLDGVGNLIGTMSNLKNQLEKAKQMMDESKDFMDDLDGTLMKDGLFDYFKLCFGADAWGSDDTPSEFFDGICDLIGYDAVLWETRGGFKGHLEDLMDKANSNDGDMIDATRTLYQAKEYIQAYAETVGDYDYDAFRDYMLDDARGGSKRDREKTLERVNSSIEKMFNLSAAIDDYLTTLENIDKLNKYYITYSVTSYVSTHINTEFEVVVNSKHYKVGSNFTSAKLAEYVLGGEFLTLCGYEGLSFVDETYKGFLDIDVPANTVPEVKTYTLDKLNNSFTHMRDFLIEFGEASVNIFNMSNFNSLAENNVDELVIMDNPSLSEYAIRLLAESGYLSDEILRECLGVTETRTLATVIDEGKRSGSIGGLFANLYSFLFASDLGEFDLTKVTLKDLRLKSIQKLAAYERDPSDSDVDNQGRFLSLFALACSDWSQDKARIPVGSVSKAGDDQWNADELDSITGISTSVTTQAIVLKLAGIDNRPYEELVDLKYTISFDMDTVDEANGDIFIICTYDEEIHKYVPFMMKNNKDALGFAGLEFVDDAEKESWLEYGYEAYTDYYVNPNPITNNGRTEDAIYFPVIARGMFDTNGNPTAIRKNGNDIEFYRENVVIRSASDIGLKTYYVEIQQARTRGGAFGLLIDTIFKKTTGKTLAEHLHSIPRVEVTSSINLPYGVSDTHLATATNGNLSLSFSFGSSSFDFSFLFEDNQSNLFLMLFVTIAIFMIIMKAVYGCVGRIIDIAILFILGPLAISTVSIKSDKKDKDGNYEEQETVYDKWKETLIEKILLAFGYVFGLNVFYMLVPMVTSTTMFANTDAFVSIPIFGSIPLVLLNMLGMLIMLVTLSSLVTYAPKMFSTIVKTGDAFGYGAQIQSQAKNVVKEVSDTVSGQRMMDAATNLKDGAKGLAKATPFSKIHEIRKDRKEKKEHKQKIASMKQEALRNGGDPAVVEKAIKAYEDALEKQKRTKSDRKKWQKDERDKRDAVRNTDWGVHEDKK